MLQRFLFIGVGGSGGETLRLVHHDLMIRLGQAGIEQMPGGWQFLHIDTRTTQEHIDGLPLLPSSDYLGLIEPRVTYSVVARQLESRNVLGAAKVSSLGWRPDPVAVFTQLDKGAGQYRAIGRAIAITQLAKIKSRIDGKIRQVQMADMTSATTALIGAEAVGTPQNPVAVVFSSLAGGSGSGIFMDVCDVLRGAGQPWAAEPVAVLYAPDVFNGLKESQRRGVQPNTLAAISELLAGYWAADPEPDPLHRAAGIQSPERGRSGPSHSFLVGSSNDNSSNQLTFAHQSEVFAAIARAMFAWCTSPAIQSEYASYLAGNWQQQAEQSDPLGLSEGRLMMPLSALGYASVGLGRDVFLRYVGQCLARATADRLLNGVVSGGHPNDSDAEDRVRQRRIDFTATMLGLPRSDTQLDGEQVIKNLPGLLDPGRAAALRQELEAVRHDLGNRPRSMAEWKRYIEGAVAEGTDDFLVRRRQALEGPVRAWVDSVQQGALKTVAASMSLDGLPVTRQLVENMIAILRNEVMPGMERNAIDDERAASKAPTEIDLAANGVSPGRFGRRNRLFDPDTRWIRDAVRRAVDSAMGRRFDAEVRRLTARLLREVVDGLLRPLSVELDRALRALNQDSTTSADQRTSVIGRWPQAPDLLVPANLRPGRTRFLVDPVADYPATFKRLLQQAVPGAERIDDALAGAVQHILTSPQAADLIVGQSRTWRPAMVADWTDKIQQDAVFTIPASAAQLLDRCLDWANRTPTLGPYLAETLADALGQAQPSTQELERLDRYRTRFAQALAASAPLVRVDTNYHAMHLADGVAEYTPLISPIPLSEGTPAYALTRELLMAYGHVPEERLDALFSPSGSGEIEFTTFLTAPRHPIGFSSLMDPIRQEWRRKQNTADGRDSFARWRRARPLTRAVGLPQPVRHRLMRGWLIAFLTGAKLEFVEDQQALLQLRLHDDDPTPAGFPLLGRRPKLDDPLDGLAAVLESFGLAFVDALESDRTLEAYQRLLTVGLETPLHPPADLLPHVQRWIEQLDRYQPATSSTPVDRLVELRADLNTVLSGLATELGGRS